MNRIRNIQINVDDFGLDKSIDESIIELCKLRKVESCSVICNYISTDSLKLLSEFEDLGGKIKLHLNLVQGKILSRAMRTYLQSDLFPNSDWWLKLNNDQLPAPEIIKLEFEEQYKILRENNFIVTGIDFHQRYPISHPFIWNIYKDFARDHNLTFRGNKFHFTASNPIKTITIGSIKIIANALAKDPFNSFKNLKAIDSSEEGHYYSDFGLLNNTDNIEALIVKLQALNYTKKVELIAHTANSSVFNSNITLKQERYKEYLSIKGLVYEFF